MLACFALLFLQLNNIQVLQASSLANAQGNPRAYLKRVAAPRGTIQTADGVVVAQSVPSHDSLKYLRVYPHGPLYSTVTGYDSLIYGTSGVEQTYNKYLQPHTAPLQSISDLLAPRTTTDSLTLTISSTLQSVAASALGNRHGAVVALDPSTGAILAMYSSPSFDPNLLASHNNTTEVNAWKSYIANPSQPLLPRAYRQIYPPGSTFKIVTSSAAFDRAPNLATKIFPTLTALPLPQTTHKLHNYANELCGGSLAQAFKVSCDSTYGQLGLDLGAQKLYTEAQSFGFDQVPPIDLPLAAPSSFPKPATFTNQLPALAFSAIGQQNVAASALQMAEVTGAIANGGKMMTPHVMAQIHDAQGNLIKSYQPSVWKQATSQATAGAVSKFMQGVTQPGGTASNVALPGVTVAAKTGTAQIGLHNGYTDDWLVAFAPAQNPSIAVAVVVTNQPPPSTGSSQAGPVARAVLQAALSMKRG